MPNRLIDSDRRYRKSLLSVQNVDLWWAGTFDSHSLACGVVVYSYPGNWRTTAGAGWPARIRRTTLESSIKALGITVPLSLIGRADSVIE